MVPAYTGAGFHCGPAAGVAKLVVVDMDDPGIDEADPSTHHLLRSTFKCVALRCVRLSP
jgi:hypothetical protein